MGHEHTNHDVANTVPYCRKMRTVTPTTFCFIYVFSSKSCQVNGVAGPIQDDASRFALHYQSKEKLPYLTSLQ